MALVATRTPWHVAAIVVVVLLAFRALGPAPIILAGLLVVFLIVDARISRQQSIWLTCRPT